MENLTIGQIGVAVAFLVGLITGIGYLKKNLKDWINQALEDRFDEIDRKIAKLESKIDDLGDQIVVTDREATKSFLVRFLASVEHDNPIDEVERLRFAEQYEHYINAGGNSYIKDKVEKLKIKGKL